MSFGSTWRTISTLWTDVARISKQLLEMQQLQILFSFYQKFLLLLWLVSVLVLVLVSVLLVVAVASAAEAYSLLVCYYSNFQLLVVEEVVAAVVEFVVVVEHSVVVLFSGIPVAEPVEAESVVLVGSAEPVVAV